MAHIRLPDDLTERPEVVEIGTAAVCLHIAALCYAVRHLTAGKLPSAQVRRLTDAEDTTATVVRLVAAGWWTQEEDGYRLVYLLDLQPVRQRLRRAAD